MILDATTLHTVLRAISFANRRHVGQFRKDRKTPYAAHPVRVLVILLAWGVTEADLLVGGTCHDTLEDTATDRDDIDQEFGSTAGGYVATVTKDMRLQHDERERMYYRVLRLAAWQERVLKAADSYDNFLDSRATATSQLMAGARKKVELVLELLHGDEAPVLAAKAALTELLDTL